MAFQQATAANGGQPPTAQQVNAMQAQLQAQANVNSHASGGMAQMQQMVAQQTMQQQHPNLAHQTQLQQQNQPSQVQNHANLPSAVSDTTFNPQSSPQRPPISIPQTPSHLQQQNQQPQLHSYQNPTMSANMAPDLSPDGASTPGFDSTDSEGRKRKRTSTGDKDGKRSRLSETGEANGAPHVSATTFLFSHT